MKKAKCFFQTRNVLVFTLLLFISASSQAPPTPEQILQKQGVETTTPALRSALLDPRPNVRGFAAAILADRKDIQSLPRIYEALNRAKDPYERISLAQALITFGDSQGHAAMQSICKDATVPVNLRLTVTSILLDLNDRACIGSIPAMLSSISDDSGTRLIALQFLLSDKPNELMSSNELKLGLEKSLRDVSATVRQDASRCIVLFNVPLARRLLVSSIAKELDHDTRIKMQNDLKELGALHRQ